MATKTAAVRSVDVNERTHTYVTMMGGVYKWPQTHLVASLSGDTDFTALQEAVLDREYVRGFATFFHNRL